MSALRLVHSAGGQARPADPFAPAREQFERSQAFLLTEEARTMKHSDMERELEKRGLELARKQYEGWLKSLAPAQAEGAVVDAEGQQRTPTISTWRPECRSLRGLSRERAAT